MFLKKISTKVYQFRPSQWQYHPWSYVANVAKNGHKWCRRPHVMYNTTYKVCLCVCVCMCQCVGVLLRFRCCSEKTLFFPVLQQWNKPKKTFFVAAFMSGTVPRYCRSNFCFLEPTRVLLPRSYILTGNAINCHGNTVTAPGSTVELFLNF